MFSWYIFGEQQCALKHAHNSFEILVIFIPLCKVLLMNLVVKINEM